MLSVLASIFGFFLVRLWHVLRLDPFTNWTNSLTSHKQTCTPSDFEQQQQQQQRCFLSSDCVTVSSLLRSSHGQAWPIAAVLPLLSLSFRFADFLPSVLLLQALVYIMFFILCFFSLSFISISLFFPFFWCLTFCPFFCCFFCSFHPNAALFCWCMEHIWCLDSCG